VHQLEELLTSGAAVDESGELIQAVRELIATVVVYAEPNSTEFEIEINGRVAELVNAPIYPSKARGILQRALGDINRGTATTSDHSHPPEQEGTAGDDGDHGDRQGDYLAPKDAGGLRLGAGRVRAVGKAAHNETIPGSR
jgi:hypothetical protein